MSPIPQVIFVVTILLTTAAQATTSNLRPLLDAIRQVESGGKADPGAGDGGRSIGPYQIQRAYWRDSGVPGSYRQVRNAAYAERVILAYWKRHVPQALSQADWSTLARVHNGGPAGHRKNATLPYWQRVRKVLSD
jgi:hypothetical protein